MADETETPTEDETETETTDEFAGFTEEDYRRAIFVAREGVRRLESGIEVMEENRDHWMARAERAEAALAQIVEDAQVKLQEIRTPNGG